MKKPILNACGILSIWHRVAGVSYNQHLRQLRWFQGLIKLFAHVVTDMIWLQKPFIIQFKAWWKIRRNRILFSIWSGITVLWVFASRQDLVVWRQFSERQGLRQAPDNHAPFSHIEFVDSQPVVEFDCERRKRAVQAHNQISPWPCWDNQFQMQAQNACVRVVGQ